MDKKQILKALIIFYNDPQTQTLKEYKNFDAAMNEFENNIEPYLNKAIGMDRIYTSLTNCSHQYIVFKSDILNAINMRNMKGYKKEQLYMTANETYINALVICLSKLNELLRSNKKLITLDDALNRHFSYLDELIGRIDNSKLTDIRNGWFAHPFQNEKKGLVYKSKDITDSIFTMLGDICKESDREEYNSSQDRLLWFCNKYLMHQEASKKTALKTQAKEILRELNYFSKILKKEKLLDTEPLFMVPPREKASFNLSPSKYIENYNPQKILYN